MCMGGIPCHTLHSVPQGNEFDAMSLVMGRYESMSVQSNRGYLKASMRTTQVHHAEELEATLLQLERNIKTYENLAGRPFCEEGRAWRCTAGTRFIDR